MVAMKLELARGQMGYTGFSLDGFTIYRRMPISPTLSEAQFIEALWSIEAMLNALVMVAAQTNISRQSVIDAVKGKSDEEEKQLP